MSIIEKILKVDVETRAIIFPSGFTNIGVAGDKKTLRLYFRLPRYYGGLDLSTNTVRINYFNAIGDGGVFVPDDVAIGDDVILFSWLVDELMTKYSGTVRFNVTMENSNRVKVYNTTNAYTRVLEGTDPSASIKKTYPEIVKEWKEELFGKFNGTVDPTLKISGTAADAEVTGTKIKKLEYAISSPFNFKGSTTFAKLPSSGLVNDTYYCTDKKCRYTYNGTGWFQSSLNESDYADELTALGTEIDRKRNYGYCAEGEIIIDLANRMISCKSLLFTSDKRSFVYINQVDNPMPFGHTGSSLASIFVVVDEGSYHLYMGDEAFMNTFEKVYYICGYYQKKLVGNNFSPKLNITIDGATKLARECVYNGDYAEMLAMFEDRDKAIEDTKVSLKKDVYASNSTTRPYVEMLPDELSLLNTTIDSDGNVQYIDRLDRVVTENLIPTLNTYVIEVYLDSSFKYAATPYSYDENGEYLTATGYYTSKNGILNIPVTEAYTRLQICRTDNTNISPTEIYKMRLISKAKSLNVTTLDMIPNMLLSEGTTHIKLFGDSITQGMGSTGYVGYSITENGKSISVRGNGPDYPNKDADYVQGDYLSGDGGRRWYESTSSTGWANKLKTYFEKKFNCVVKNYGMSGIASGDLLGHCSGLVTDDDDIIMLMIGTNDRANTTIDNFKANVTTFVHQLLLANKKVVLLSSLPAAVSGETTVSYHMEDVSTILRSIAYNTGVAYISVYDEILDYCDDKDVSVDDLLGDGLHPNDYGYDVMFKIISKKLGVSIKRDGATW